MKLATFEVDGSQSVGIVQEDKVYSLGHVYNSMTDLIKALSQDRMEDLAAAAQQGKCHHIAQVRILAPIPMPIRNVMCVGWNYLKHFNERTVRGIDLPERPTFFTKATTSVIGPDDVIPLMETFTDSLDYEGELAVIIASEGRNITEEEAARYIFGYTIANDISARDIQHAHGGQWFKGKSMDGSCPLGPYIVTVDEIPEPQNLNISCLVNGVIKQESNTRHMMFSISKLISELSNEMTLLPGDILLTGTPEGVGAKRVPPEFLQHGDRVEVRVEGVGVLTNLVLQD